MVREVFHFEGVEEEAREEGAKHVAARSILGWERSSTSFRTHCFLYTENSNCTSYTHLQSSNSTIRNKKKLLQAERLLNPQPSTRVWTHRSRFRRLRGRALRYSGESGDSDRRGAERVRERIKGVVLEEDGERKAVTRSKSDLVGE